MSAAGWQAFLAADGLEDWVVLHGGATVAFRVPTLAAAGELVGALSAVDGFEESGVLVTIAGHHVTVRLARGVFKIEERHIALARGVSAVARAHGAVAEPAAMQEVSVAIAAKPDAIDVRFWRAVLGYDALDED